MVTKVVLSYHTILLCIKACDGCSQNFNKETDISQVLIQILEIGVNMVSIPGVENNLDLKVGNYYAHC